MQYNKLIRSYVSMVWRDLRPIIVVWNVNAYLLLKQFMLQLLFLICALFAQTCQSQPKDISKKETPSKRIDKLFFLLFKFYLFFMNTQSLIKSSQSE